MALKDTPKVVDVRRRERERERGRDATKGWGDNMTELAGIVLLWSAEGCRWPPGCIAVGQIVLQKDMAFVLLLNLLSGVGLQLPDKPKLNRDGDLM